MRSQKLSLFLLLMGPEVELSATLLAQVCHMFPMFFFIRAAVVVVSLHSKRKPKTFSRHAERALDMDDMLRTRAIRTKKDIAL